MDPVLGNHIGIVVNSNPDPEGRNRVQIFVPHLSTTLYENWNKDAKDITMVQGSLAGIPLNVLERLQQILPWAECAFPLFGAGGTTYGDAYTGLTRLAHKSGAPMVETNSSTSADKEKPSIPNLSSLLSGGVTNTSAGNVLSSNVTNSATTLKLNNNSIKFGNLNTPAYRLNNPGNLHITSTPYPGQTDVTVEDVKPGESKSRGKIAGFVSMEYGIAANLNQIYSYINGTAGAAKRAGGPLDTISKIEKYWVNEDVPAEGERAAQDVSLYSGIDKNQRIDPNDTNQMMNLMAGMMMAETSRIPPNFVEKFQGGFDLFQKRKGLTTDLSASDAVNATFPGKVIDSTFQPSTTDMRVPNGMNSAPLAGTYVWCFFLGGDIQRPVYFAGVTEKNAAARNSAVPSSYLSPGSGTLTGNTVSGGTAVTVSGGAGRSTSVKGSTEGFTTQAFIDQLTSKAYTDAENNVTLDNGRSRDGTSCFSGVKQALKDIGVFSSYPSSNSAELGLAKNSGVMYSEIGLTNVFDGSMSPDQAQVGDILVYDKPGQAGHTEVVTTNPVNGSKYYSSDINRPTPPSANSGYKLIGVYRKTT